MSRLLGSFNRSKSNPSTPGKSPRFCSPCGGRPRTSSGATQGSLHAREPESEGRKYSFSAPETAASPEVSPAAMEAGAPARLLSEAHKDSVASAVGYGPEHWLRGLLCGVRMDPVVATTLAAGCLLALAGASMLLPRAGATGPARVGGRLEPRAGPLAVDEENKNWQRPPPREGGSMWQTMEDMQPTQGPAAGPPQLAPSELLWLFCSGEGHCGDQRLRHWRKNPERLAQGVGDFTRLAGVPSGSYGPVAERWAQRPPRWRGKAVRLQELAAFARELLASDPFSTGGSVPYLDLGTAGGGKVVAVTQRQLAFLVVNVLLGNDLEDGGGNGLGAAVLRCSSKEERPQGFLYSLLSFLAVLSQELKTGQQGSLLVAATPGDAAGEQWRETLSSALRPPTICGLDGEGCGLPDFMAGGTPHQAMTDIAGSFVGGGAQLCDLANSQDESAVQFYSEALAFSFFVKGDGMLPVPLALLGARRYMSDFGGETSLLPPQNGRCGMIKAEDWLNEEIPTATTAAKLVDWEVRIASSAFVAVASECSGCSKGNCTQADLVNNACPSQRGHVDADISRWYQAYELTMYNTVVQGAFGRVVRRVGTGPWGAGVWWGDSQLYFLTVWLATSLLTTEVGLDYYLYRHFCENPGNQCLLLGANGCEACVATGGPGSLVQKEACGTKSLFDVVAYFRNQAAGLLRDRLLTVGKPPTQIFDGLSSTMVFKK